MNEVNSVTCFILFPFQFFSRCFYELTRDAKRSPGKEVIQQWLVAISEWTGVEPRLTPSIHTKLADRAHVVQTKVKRLARRGGRQMNDYLDLKWTFEVPMIDVIQKVVDENKRLTQNLDKAKTKVQKLQTCLADLSNRNCQEQMGNSSSRAKRKSVESCGERHLRRIKRKRAASCVASLAWLESEDCIPLKLTVQNRQWCNRNISAE